MKKVIRWIRSWFVVRFVNTLNQKVAKAKADFSKLLIEMNVSHKRLKHYHKRLDAISTSILEEIDASEEVVARAEKNQISYQNALDAMSARLRVVEETTIPTLIESHRVLLERYRAETAIQVRRQAASNTGE